MNNKDQYYEKALEEIESNSYIKSTYAKAIRYSNGDDSKIKSLYIKYRVNFLIEEETRENEALYKGKHNIFTRRFLFIIVTPFVIAVLFSVLAFYSGAS